MTIDQERRQFEADEKRFARLVFLGNQLDIPVLVPIWRIKIGDGKKCRVHRRWFARSWTRNAYNAHANQSMDDIISGTFGDGTLSLKGVDSSLVDDYQHDQNAETVGGYFGAAGTDALGLIAGTGSTEEKFDDFVLDSLIEHGGNPGELSYGASGLDSKGWNGGSLYHWSIWERELTNNSGGTITVAELGVINHVSAGTFLFVRDVLVPTQDVLSLEVLTLQCEFRQSFPS